MIWSGVRPLPRSARLCFPPSPSAQTKNRQSLILFTSPDCKTIPFSKNATQLNRNKSRAGSLWLITQWSWKWLLLSANILNSWKQNYIFLKILILFHFCARNFQSNQKALLAIKLFTEQCIQIMKILIWLLLRCISVNGVYDVSSDSFLAIFRSSAGVVLDIGGPSLSSRCSGDKLACAFASDSSTFYLPSYPMIKGDLQNL